MFNNLSALALGIVIFAILIGVGVVLLQKFQGAVACPTGYVFNSSATEGGGTECYESANASNTTAYKTIGNDLAQFKTELGTTSGLGSWTAAIVALAVGLLFIGALMGNRKY